MKKEKEESDSVAEKTTVFDESIWCRRRSERIFLSDSSPVSNEELGLVSYLFKHVF